MIYEKEEPYQTLFLLGVETALLIVCEYCCGLST